MSKKVQADGFRLQGVESVIPSMTRQHGLTTGIRCRYNAPEGYMPGKDDDDRKGFGPGSEIMTTTGTLYKCLRADSGKAVWYHVKTEMTDSSYVPPNPDAIKKEVASPAPEPEPEPAPEPTPEDTSPQAEKSEPTDTEDHDLLEGFDNVPFEGYFKKNDITRLSQIQEHLANGTLKELSYFNEERAEKVREWVESFE